MKPYDLKIDDVVVPEDVKAVYGDYRVIAKAFSLYSNGKDPYRLAKELLLAMEKDRYYTKYVLRWGFKIALLTKVEEFLKERSNKKKYY
jgi:hypothetical protein